MAYSYDTKCSHCGKPYHVQEAPMGVPGGKDKEEIFCPWCHQIDGYMMTDGFVRTEKIEEHD